MGTTIIAVLIFILFTETCFTRDSIQWRGPTRNGMVPNFRTPDKWPDKLTLKWTVSVGPGISAPIVFRDMVWTHTRKGEEEVVSAIDLKSGKILWSKSYVAPFDPHPAAVKIGKGPFSTPVFSDGTICTLGITAILSCFDAANGELKWRKQFGRIDTSNMFTGTSMSPLIDNENLIVQVGDDRSGSFYAFDSSTGKQIWKWTGDGSSYASPIIGDFFGVRQIIAMTNQAMISLSPQTGQLLWRMHWPDDMKENIVTPVQYKNMLIISNTKNGVAAVKIAKNKDEWQPSLAWHTPEIVMYMSSPILDGDYLYGISDKRKGQFFCMNAATGKIVWLTDGKEGFNATFLHAKDTFFILTDQGRLIVAKKNPSKFEKLAMYPVSQSRTLAHLVISNQNILIKDERNLSLWNVR